MFTLILACLAYLLRKNEHILLVILLVMLLTLILDWMMIIEIIGMFMRA